MKSPRGPGHLPSSTPTQNQQGPPAQQDTPQINKVAPPPSERKQEFNIFEKIDSSNNRQPQKTGGLSKLNLVKSTPQTNTLVAGGDLSTTTTTSTSIKNTGVTPFDSSAPSFIGSSKSERKNEKIILPQILVHWTPSENLDGIRKGGIKTGAGIGMGERTGYFSSKKNPPSEDKVYVIVNPEGVESFVTLDLNDRDPEAVFVLTPPNFKTNPDNNYRPLGNAGSIAVGEKGIPPARGFTSQNGCNAFSFVPSENGEITPRTGQGIVDIVRSLNPGRTDITDVMAEKLLLEEIKKTFPMVYLGLHPKLKEL